MGAYSVEACKARLPLKAAAQPWIGESCAHACVFLSLTGVQPHESTNIVGFSENLLTRALGY